MTALRLLVLLVPIVTHPVFAQQATDDSSGAAGDGPMLTMDFPETEAIPGQPLRLRLTVLVPTFMPQPPVWPSMETSNVLVRLPERSTTPISKRIGGATWSGIMRSYQLSPMVPGEFFLPPREVVVTYADPETSAPIRVTLTTDAVRFAGALPQGAENLDPFIAAQSLELKQTIEGEPGSMKPGDSASRTIVAEVRGVSPMFLPALQLPIDVDGIAAYPDEPRVEEAEDRGVIAGSRTERVTLVAEGGGRGEAPVVTLDWYNLQSGKVESATADGFDIAIDGPPAITSEPRDWRLIALVCVGALLALVVLSWLLRRIVPPLLQWSRDRHAAKLASEEYAFRQLRRVVSKRDNAALRPALDAWSERVRRGDPREDVVVQGALVAIGAARYGHDGMGGEDAGWRALADAIVAARTTLLDKGRAGDALPPLNPGGQPFHDPA